MMRKHLMHDYKGNKPISITFNEHKSSHYLTEGVTSSMISIKRKRYLNNPLHPQTHKSTINVCLTTKKIKHHSIRNEKSAKNILDKS